MFDVVGRSDFNVERGQKRRRRRSRRRRTASLLLVIFVLLLSLSSSSERSEGAKENRGGGGGRSTKGSASSSSPAEKARGGGNRYTKASAAAARSRSRPRSRGRRRPSVALGLNTRTAATDIEFSNEGGGGVGGGTASLGMDLPGQSANSLLASINQHLEALGSDVSATFDPEEALERRREMKTRRAEGNEAGENEGENQREKGARRDPVSAAESRDDESQRSGAGGGDGGGSRNSRPKSTGRWRQQQRRKQQQGGSGGDRGGGSGVGGRAKSAPRVGLRVKPVGTVYDEGPELQQHRGRMEEGSPDQSPPADAGRAKSGGRDPPLVPPPQNGILRAPAQRQIRGDLYSGNGSGDPPPRGLDYLPISFGSSSESYPSSSAEEEEELGNGEDFLVTSSDEGVRSKGSSSHGSRGSRDPPGERAVDCFPPSSFDALQSLNFSFSSEECRGGRGMGNGTGRGSSETSSSSSRAARAAAAASPVAEEKARRGTSAGSSYENSIDPPTGDDDSVAPIYSDADGQVLLRLGSEDSREFEKNGSLLFSSSSGSTDSNNEEEENRSSDELLSSSRSTVRTSGVGEGSGRPTPIMTSIGTPRFGGGGVGRTYDTPRSRDTPRSDALPHYAEQSPSSSFSHRTTPRLGNISVADGRFQRRRDRHQRQVDLTTRQAQAQTQTQAPSPQRADQVSLSQALPNGSRGGHQHLDEATMAQTAYADMSSALETTMRRKKDLRKLIQINEHRDRGGATPSPSTSAAREEVGEAAADEGRPLLHQHQRPGNHRHLTQTMTKSVFDDSISFNETIVTDNGSNHSSGPSTLAASHQRSGNHRRPTQTMMKSVLDISDSFNETTSGNTRPVGLSGLHFFGGGTVSQPLNAMSPTGNSVTFGRFGDDDVSLLSGITGDFPVSPTVANIVSPGVSAEGIVRVSSSSSSVQAKLLGKISEDSHKVGDLNRKMKHTEGGRGPDDPDGGRRVAHTDTPDLRDRRGGGTGGDRSRNSAPPLKVDPNKSASHRPMAITPRSRKVLRLQQMRRNRSSGNSSSVSSRDKYESAAPIINERRRGYDAIGKDNDNCSSTVDMESLSSSSTGMYSGSAARGYLALKSEISVKPHESGPSHLEDGCEPPPPSPGGADRGMAGSSAMMGQVRSSVSPDTKENGQDQYSLGVPKTKESALELAPIGKKQAGNGSERSRYHKALNARRRLRHTQSNGRASSPSRSSSSSLSTASGRANRNLAGRLQTPSPAGHSAPSSTEGTTPRGKEQPNWRGRSHSSGAANNLGRSSGSMASSSHGDPNNSGLAPPTTQGQREPKAHQPQIGPQIPPTAHSTHQIEQIIDTEATGLPPIPPNHRGIVQSSLQRPLIQPSVNDNGFQQIDTQYDQASPSSYESSDTDDSEVQVERFPLTKSPAQPGATGQDQHRRRMKSVSVAPDSIDPEIGSIDTGRGEDCQIFELKRILQILVCGAKELPKKIFDPPGNIKDGLKCGIVDRSISQDHQDMQRLGRSESDSSLIEENDIFEGNDDSPTQPATHDHNGHNVTMPQEHTTNLAEPPISADPRRGVRRKDEGDTSTLQAQRAKRMLHGNRLISFPSNRLVDRQFMAILNDSDGRELSAIVKGMCDDPNDKFRTVIFSQHDPSVCKAVFGALTKERLGDLDENAKVSLIRVLAIGNNQSDAFRFMARLWTSINQRNRVLVRFSLR